MAGFCIHHGTYACTFRHGTIMVDELRQWPTSIRCFESGSCHLTTDGPLEELHAFAARLGLKREWYQEHRIAPHYDLTAGRRVKALELGAVFVPMREQIRRRRGEADLKASTKKTLVVHCRRAPFDVYIGRPSIWGNPHVVGGRGGLTRTQAIAAFEVYLQSKPEFIERAKRELRGKVLGCFCKPLACHGDILAEIANG